MSAALFYDLNHTRLWRLNVSVWDWRVWAALLDYFRERDFLLYETAGAHLRPARDPARLLTAMRGQSLHRSACIAKCHRCLEIYPSRMTAPRFARILAIIGTVVAIYLHILFGMNAGALWRDEVNSPRGRDNAHLRRDVGQSFI